MKHLFLIALCLGVTLSVAARDTVFVTPDVQALSQVPGTADQFELPIYVRNLRVSNGYQLGYLLDARSRATFIGAEFNQNFPGSTGDFNVLNEGKEVRILDFPFNPDDTLSFSDSLPLVTLVLRLPPGDSLLRLSCNREFTEFNGSGVTRLPFVCEDPLLPSAPVDVYAGRVVDVLGGGVAGQVVSFSRDGINYRDTSDTDGNFSLLLVAEEERDILPDLFPAEEAASYTFEGISNLDRYLLLLELKSTGTLNEAQRAAADTNVDGQLDQKDTDDLQRAILRRESDLGTSVGEFTYVVFSGDSGPSFTPVLSPDIPVTITFIRYGDVNASGF